MEPCCSSGDAPNFWTICGIMTRMSANEIRKRFTPIVHHEGDAYWAEIPAMPGCLTVADTLDELAPKLMEAMACWLLTAEDAKRFRLGKSSVRRSSACKMAVA